MYNLMYHSFNLVEQKKSYGQKTGSGPCKNLEKIDKKAEQNVLKQD